MLDKQAPETIKTKLRVKIEEPIWDPSLTMKGFRTTPPPVMSLLHEDYFLIFIYFLKVLIEFVSTYASVLCWFLFFFYAFWSRRHVGSYLPNQGLKLHPLHWKVKSKPLDHQGSLNIPHVSIKNSSWISRHSPVLCVYIRAKDLQKLLVQKHDQDALSWGNPQLARVCGFRMPARLPR